MGFSGCKTLLSICVSPNSHIQLTMCWSSWIFILVQFSHSVVSNSLQPHEPQHARPPCPSPTPGVYPNSCPLSWWCHPTISFSVIDFTSCLQSFPTLGSFPMSQLFASDGQNIGVSALASFLPKNIQDWPPLEWTGWITLQSMGLSRVFSNTTIQKHQFFGAQLSSQSNSHIHTWPQENIALTRRTTMEFPISFLMHGFSCFPRVKIMIIICYGEFYDPSFTHKKCKF